MTCFILGRRSLGAGIGAVLAVGYFYGIVRAHVLDSFSYCMFDAAVFGLYLAQFTRAVSPAVRMQTRKLAIWLVVLMGWPCFVFLIPVNHPLIQLVGLRAAIYFLPFLLLGGMAQEVDLNRLARWLAVLNLLAFTFALMEYSWGLEAFYPRNAVTEIIWNSKDVAGQSAYRIPGTFVNAHAYGNTMLAALPLLINRWQMRSAFLEKLLMLSALATSGLGIFMCGARQPIVILFLELGILMVLLKLPLKTVLGLVVLGGLVGYFVAGSERFQRFLSLADTDFVADRIHSSANVTFFDMVCHYPLGAGLGSAFGTNIPYFLSDIPHEQVGLENEYSRIALEQSPLGLLLWLGFILWTVTRLGRPIAPAWVLGTRMIRVFVALMWATAFIGVGMLAAIPGTPLLLFEMGILARSTRG